MFLIYLNTACFNGCTAVFDLQVAVTGRESGGSSLPRLVGVQHCRTAAVSDL